MLLSVGGVVLYKKTFKGKDACKPRFRKSRETCRTSKGCMYAGSSSRDWNQANGLVTEDEAGLQMMGDWAKGEFVNVIKFAGKVITTVLVCDFTGPRHGPAQRTAEPCTSEPPPRAIKFLLAKCSPSHGTGGDGRLISLVECVRMRDAFTGSECHRRSPKLAVPHQNLHSQTFLEMPMGSFPFSRTHVSGAIGTLGLGLAAALLIAPAAQASSHREAPFITGAPKVDATDLYMFRSYETGREAFVTILADYMPFQDPQGGPNFYMFDPNALYEIHIDNDGDSVEDITYQFRFKNESKETALSIGGKPVKIPLINSGVISGVNPAALDVRETFTIDVVNGNRRGGSRNSITNAVGDAAVFDKPVDNIGDKTFGGATGYATYANQHIYNVKIPDCATPGRVFVGQRKEPFYIAVGKAFDLLNFPNPSAAQNGINNDLEAKNVSTLALEVPIACLIKGSETVIGAYTTASLRQGRVLDGSPKTGQNKVERSRGAWTQVSRLGMPLVNELIIGTSDKDKFNASKPKNDDDFALYVTNPVLPALIETLFPAAVAPTNFPRNDLVTVFLKGIDGVNQPKNVKAGEMLRLNTSTPVTAVVDQNPLGVALDDFAGYPNGRRPADDVVDISLRVAMGALCVKTGSNDTLKLGCTPAVAPSGALPFNDGVRKTAINYGVTFPYLTTPIPGNFNPPAATGTTYP